ncbi:hypothetical protein U1Q18_043700 [Sarracenia purpurea var. burkii]
MLHQNSCDYVIRPKGWGKTLNMDMLRRFFDLETYPNGVSFERIPRKKANQRCDKITLLRDNYFYSFLDEKYSKYYGFREHDLDKLFANVSFTPDREKIRHWYGYKFQDNEQLYHPGKIMRYIASNGTFDYYWLDPKYTGIDQTLLLDDMQTHIRNLSIGLSVKSYANLTNERNFAKINPINQHVLLLYFGFLTPSNGKWNETEQQQLEHLLQFKVIEWVAGKLNVTIKDLSQMEGDTLIEKVERFRDALGRRVELLSDVVSCVRPSDRRKSATIENLSQNASDGQFLGDGLMTSTEKSSR